MLHIRLSTTLLLAATAGLCLIADAVDTVTCEGDVAWLTCGPGKFIYVQWAGYGRSDRTTCSAGRPHSQVQHTSCTKPNDIVARSCDGRNNCAIDASNSVFGDPCSGTYKYLEVVYTCEARSVTCEGNLAHLNCGPGQFISVQWAVYGRSDRTTCSAGRPYSQIQYTGCTKPNDIVARSCDGRNNCAIDATNSVFGDPCYNTYKYLEVFYTCEGPIPE